MKIISWNVNGLRAVWKKNFLEWLEKTNADIICLQEIKMQKNKLSTDLLALKNYHLFFNFADRKGYSGVAIFAKTKPISVKQKLGSGRFDHEGRILNLQFPGFILINVYIPHGGRQKENLNYKLMVYGKLLKYLKKIKNQKVILVGDFNIAHQEIDLARPKQNKNNIMFLPEEKKQIDKIIKLGFADTFRMFHRDSGHYTWWPYFANARQRNLGWRIDYVFVSRCLLPKIKKSFILDKVTGSDHCPVGAEIN